MSGRLSYGGLLRSLLSAAMGLLLAGIVMQGSGYNPAEAFRALWTGASGLHPAPSQGADDLSLHLGSLALGCLNLSSLANSLYRTTPLIFTGLSVALGRRAGLFNIGAAGQMIAGALAAAAVGLIGANGKNGALPPLVHLPLTMLAGAAAGAVWGAIPGLLKAYRGVHEVIVTIMLNFTALNIASYLITHNLRDTANGTMAPQSPLTARSAWLTPFVPNTALTMALPLALLAAWGISFLIRRTALGYEIRAVGQGTEAARAAGIPAAAIITKTMALCGGLAGLAGALEIMAAQHQYVAGIEGSYGFDGIAVALLGGLNGGGIVGSALFFGALANGSKAMQIMTDVPDSIATLVQAFVIVFAGIRWLPRFAVPKTKPAERQAGNGV